MKLGFATDPHLNFVKDTLGFAKQKRLGSRIAKGLDALILAGDLSEAHYLFDHMKAFCEGAGIPVYFVLGNHDFWQAREPEDFEAPIPDVDPLAIADSLRPYGGIFLDTAGTIELTPTTALIGRTCWYDARRGNIHDSRFMQNDWKRIPRLRGGVFLRELLVELCQKWADYETSIALQQVEEAAKKYSTVYFVTHFPPYHETCFHEEDNCLPWTLNLALGFGLRWIAEQHPDTKFHVFSGHTHVPFEVEILPNLVATSGKAEYETPMLAKSWEVL